MEEIVAGADQRKTAKAAPARGHQDRTIGMTRVIAAKQEWCVRKMMSPLDRQGTIPLEEGAAKLFETQTAERGCRESVVHTSPAIHLRQDTKQMMNLSLEQDEKHRQTMTPKKVS